MALAPAKINLLLKVLGRRADNYHNLLTLFQLISLCDEIEAEEADLAELEVSGPYAEQLTRSNTAAAAENSAAERPPLAGSSSGSGSTDAANILWRAYKLMQQEAARHNTKLPPLKISLRKHIPVGAGLGGGSSDAACLMNLIRERWLPALPLPRLLELAALLGADVPVFVHGRSCWGEGIGEQLTPVQLPPRYYLLCCPQLHCSTAEVFAALDEHRKGQGLQTPPGKTSADKNKQAPDAAADINKTPAETHQSMPAGEAVPVKELDKTDINKNPDAYLSMPAAAANDLLAPACSKHPLLAQLHRQLNAATPNKLGAEVLLSGSGGTMFAVYETQQKAAVDKEQLDAARNQPASSFALPFILYLVRGLNSASELKPGASMV